jgi:hypothetical protein
MFILEEWPFLDKGILINHHVTLLPLGVRFSTQICSSPRKADVWSAFATALTAVDKQAGVPPLARAASQGNTKALEQIVYQYLSVIIMVGDVHPISSLNFNLNLHPLHPFHHSFAFVLCFFSSDIMQYTRYIGSSVFTNRIPIPRQTLRVLLDAGASRGMTRLPELQRREAGRWHKQYMTETVSNWLQKAHQGTQDCLQNCTSFAKLPKDPKGNMRAKEERFSDT